VGITASDGETYPDTVRGTDSHTTMGNGLGVVGWGVGGIEAEAAMLGRSMPMLVPEVVGFHLKGTLKPGATATDLVLTVTQMLRKKGVVNKFVEYFGKDIANLSVADRATLGNMSPEYGATIGFFPVDEQTLAYLRMTGRSEQQINLIEAYCKRQGIFRSANTPDPVFSDVLELAELIWRKVNGPDVPFRWVSDPGFEHDVQRRVPAVGKAREVLGIWRKSRAKNGRVIEAVRWAA